ncbi:unnamed protein product [Caenorhabditis angaria]|uniref:Peptidase M13 C-terminal domain-containing protein n=1 Tax=Caenorhabditis angaria TaxID=860376 RepID=A0A9P1MUU5_9PELO|nr:unnamed protein product [Caenorhabditis angaria]
MKVPAFLKKKKVQYAILITGFLLTLSLFIAILIGSVGNFINRDDFKPICETEKCFELGNRMALFMDNSTDPCNDFYKFSCGNANTALVTGEYIHGSATNYDIYEDRKMFRKYFNFSTYKPKTTPQKIAMVLMDKCVKTDTIEIIEQSVWKSTDLTDIFVEMSKVSIGKTHFLRNNIYSWAFGENIERIPLSLVLQSGIDVIFKDDYNKILDENPNFRTKKWGKSDGTTNAFKFFNIKKYLREVLPEYAKDTKWTLHYLENELMALQELVNLKGVETIRNSLKPLYNKVLESYVVEKNVTGKERDEQCFGKIEKMFPGTFAMIFVEQFVPKENLKRAKENLKELKEVFREMIDENDWMEQELKDGFKKEADLIEASLGVPEEYEDMENVEKMYESVQKTKGAEQQTYLELVRNLLKMNAEETFLRVAKKTVMTLAVKPLSWNAYFHYGAHQTSLATVLMKYPKIDMDLPSWNTIADFSHILGHEVGHAFDANSFETNQLLQKYQMSTKTREEFKKRFDCFIQKYSKYKFPDGTFSNGQKTNVEDSVDQIGFVLISRLFKKLLDDRRQQKLPVLDQYTVEQQFYLRFAYPLCCRKNTNKDIEKAKNLEYSIFEFRVNGMVSNSDDFAKAFGCAKNTPMNPEKKCPLY